MNDTSHKFDLGVALKIDNLSNELLCEIFQYVKTPENLVSD
ncbi:MAG: hypothetical protein VX777_05140 [Chlamydiota bacterium]|nr:hypothetical protein [Chlamydiota bacterium]